MRHQQLQAVNGLGQISRNIQDDIAAGALAFSVPLLYDQTAPKRWPRYGMLGTVVGVIGVYFGSRWALRQWRV